MGQNEVYFIDRCPRFYIGVFFAGRESGSSDDIRGEDEWQHRPN